MSVERRVKPSTRMMASIRKRRLTIIACAIVAVVAVVGTIVGVNIYNNSKEHGDLVTDAVATRTLLSSRTTYRGNWIEDEQGLFEVYLPGSTVEVPGTSSKAITFKRDTEYDNKLTKPMASWSGPSGLTLLSPRIRPPSSALLCLRSLRTLALCVLDVVQAVPMTLKS